MIDLLRILSETYRAPPAPGPPPSLFDLIRLQAMIHEESKRIHDLLLDRLMAPTFHEAFDRLKEQGKVRFLGVSSHTPNLEQVMRDGGSLICYRGTPVAQVPADLARLMPVRWTPARETRFRTEAMTSRIAELAIVDALVASVSLSTYDLAVECIAKTFDVLSIKRV